MRDRVSGPKGPSVDLHSLLAPAEGIEARHDLFSESPIEALDWLTELGQIAKESIEPPPAPAAEEPSPISIEEASASQTTTPQTATPQATVPQAPATTASPRISAQTSTSSPGQSPARSSESTEESRLIEALLEYHRLRGPALGARTAPRPSSSTEFARTEGSAEPTQHFYPLEIPVVKNFVAKTPTSGVRSTRPTQTILRPKPPRP